ncbi:AAA family ATPase [Acinetobacter pittii]|uniref:AAA family ATPase n=2 Tax=Acinetobacter pittii TaxID=48296 RepID=UPI00246934BB|nr:AAA family ATPase [Acinetobacter pittii]WGM23454.1 AAA family ATPase [Acinetobacter pittii]
MKLINIQIFPKGNNGWGSDLLTFGDDITQLFGPNGCGKTPIIQSIAYCLGYPCTFRQDIYDHCLNVKLKIKTEKGNLVITRKYHKSDFEIEVIEPLANTKLFFNEFEYSNYIFEWLNFDVKNLVSSSNKRVQPYLSTVLPFFYINQDSGYTKIYSPAQNFIKDQFSEMIRFLFNLPVRNSFDEKKQKILAKENLDLLDKQVEEQRRQLDNAKLLLTRKINLKTPEELRTEIQKLEQEIDSLKSMGADQQQVIYAFDKLIVSHMNSISKINNKISEIKIRTNGINQIVNEIETEINTLNLNESARRVFLSFEEICSFNSCNLFSRSSDSYAKNLLYLKDQIKDLERNREIDISYMTELESEKQFYEMTIKNIEVEKKLALEKSEISLIVESISELKNIIFDLNNQLSECEQIEFFENKYSSIQIKRNQALEIYNSFSRSEQKSIPSILKIKSELKNLLIKWLCILRTKNISLDISFSNTHEFMPILGIESIHHLTGSTRIRAVLAYHAAITELLLNNKKNKFNFLVLDTPKQHEIQVEDLDNYMKELKKLCSKFDTQVIFSTTEYHYICQKGDAEWIPEYEGKEQKMFLYMLSD